MRCDGVMEGNLILGSEEFKGPRFGRHSPGEDFLEDFFLGGSHSASLGGRGVIMPGEMKEAVDDVESEFGRGVVAEFLRAFGGDRSTDKDFAVREGDHVGRSGDPEEITMDLRHGAGAEN